MSPRRKKRRPRRKKARPPSPAAPPETRTKTRKPVPWWARIALVAIGISVPVVIELTLRLIGWGAPVPVFHRVATEEGRALLGTDPRHPVRYFFRRYEGLEVGVGETVPQVLFVPKPPGTVRVFFLGESTVQGFPQPRNLTAAVFLEEMLRDAWPDREVEVINLGVTAISSFPVLKILEEVLPYEPDVVVLYVGHNEFFGAYGVASRIRAGASPWASRVHYAVNQLRLSVAFRRLLGWIRGRPRVTRRELIEIMAGREVIPPEDPLRRAAEGNLEANLMDMVRRCRERGVPVVLATLASNEKDFTPVRSAGPELSADERRRLDDLEAAARNSGLPDDARRRAAAEIETFAGSHEGDALVRYRAAEAIWAAGDHEGAVAAYRMARDLDAMPWRAPSSFNGVITRVAEGEGAILADVEAAFRDESDHGAIGWDLMEDHLHPSVLGQGVLARTIALALAGAPEIVRLEDTDRARIRPIEEYRERLGENEIGRYAVARMMANLIGKEPLGRNNQAAATRFAELAEKLERSLKNSDREAELAAYEAWHRIRANAPGKPLALLAAQGYEQVGRPGEAEAFYRTAQYASTPCSLDELESHFTWAMMRLAQKKEIPPEAKKRMARVVGGAEILAGTTMMDDGVFHHLLGRVARFAGEHARAVTYMERALELIQGDARFHIFAPLCDSLVTIGRGKEAVEWAEQGLRETKGDPRFKELVDIMREKAGVPGP